jgi:acetyl-CoA carboxylase carboxyl transferase subunit alpha
VKEIDKEKEREKRLLARKRLRRLRARARQRRLEEEKVRLEQNQPGPAAAAREKASDRLREITALEREVAELSRFTSSADHTAADMERIRREVDELKHEFYAHSGAWQRLQLARHPQRPYTDDFVRLLFENFTEIHGDRYFGDDPALMAGMAWFHGRPVMVLGTQKGRDTKQRVARNFGQAKPEGYRKALRAMLLAAKFNRPIFVFVDTPGAFPGIDAEERGQAEAIAHNLREMSRLPVPIIVTITGEGGSGGALGIAVGDRIFMLENSVYSVISPEGCASIIWRDSTKAEIAADALKITAPDLLGLKLIDEIVSEPEGGAHTDHAAAAKLLDPVLARSLEELTALAAPQLVEQRYEKFRRMGQFFA